MAWGLPKIPGLSFSDPTKTQHHIKSTLRFYQGYRFPDSTVRAPGGEPTDVDSNAFGGTEDSVNYDPSMTYGRVKQPAFPAVIPHWVHYDKRCLNFTAFMKQPVFESPDEKYRVRLVNIVYFIEDDSMTVMEPRVRNSGIWQGRMVKRGKIPKNDQGEYWHWKDLDVGKDICIYGKVFHTISCDLFTKEWLESQGLEISKPEDIPTDPYTLKERWKSVKPPTLKRSNVDTLRRFLEYDGRVLSFDCLWDDRESENGEMHQYKLLYFLQDDTIAIKELHDGKGGRDPFPLLLKKTKLPKKWKEIPVTFPSISMEVTEDEVTEYYAPKDLIVGQTVYVLGRRCLLFDCDNFTRKYFKTMLNIDQPPAVEVPKEEKREHVTKLPPHIGIGTPEDSLQSCFGLMPKRPHKDVIKYNLNASKYLRYLCELDWIHPEDKGRQFVMSYSLADGSIKVGEIPRRNSGFREGTFLKSMKLQTPDSDPNFPTYFTPEKFYIGSIVPIFKHRFRITGCDLFVYRYMSANPEKFPPEVIDNVRNYHLREGNLKDELEEAVHDEQLQQKRAELAKIGEKAVAEPSPMERCLEALNVSEESAIPIRPPSPPATTDRISYDDSLRIARQSKPPCDNVAPLKGILKSGTARDDHQKVVCFSGPVPDQREKKEPTQSKYPQEGRQFNEDEDFCEKYKDLGADERAERRRKDICSFEVVPKADQGDATAKEQANISGHLGNYGVDCRKTPEYMRLPPNAYEMAKKMRQEVPEISPGAAKVAGYPPLPFPDVTKCTEPIQPDPCKRTKENVLFACPRVEPVVKCCDPRKRDPPEF